MREADVIRRDTTFVRKLVGTGEELRRGTDVIDILRPLLPLRVDEADSARGDTLDLLPRVLSERGVGEDPVKTVVQAFRDQRPLVEALHLMLHGADGSP